MTDDIFIASLEQYGYLDQVFSRIKEELRYLPDTDELRKVVSAAAAYSRTYTEMGSETISREAASEFIDECSKHPAVTISGLDLPGDEYGLVGTGAKSEQAAGSSKKSRRGAKLPAGAAEFTEKEETLFEALRALRREIASEEKVPPYIVFSDKTLTHMCILKPVTEAEMLEVSGVGAYKFEKYGERFLESVRKYLES